MQVYKQVSSQGKMLQDPVRWVLPFPLLVTPERHSSIVFSQECCMFLSQLWVSLASCTLPCGGSCQQALEILPEPAASCQPPLTIFTVD